MEGLSARAYLPASTNPSTQQPAASCSQSLCTQGPAHQSAKPGSFHAEFQLRTSHRHDGSAARCTMGVVGLMSHAAGRLGSEFTANLLSNSLLQAESRRRGCEAEQVPANGRGGKVVCMAHPRRVQMVAQQIGRELGDMLLRDKVLKEAIVPESALGSDMFLSSVATISEVEVSSDLQVAKVYVSLFGDQRGRDIAMEGLRSKQGYVRAGLGKRMNLRMTPEVRFIEDDSLERGSRVLAIINKLKDDREKREAGEVVLHNATLNDDDLEEAEVRPVRQERRKKAAAGKKSPRSDKERQSSWGQKENPLTEEDVKDLRIGDDENIIFVK